MLCPTCPSAGRPAAPSLCCRDSFLESACASGADTQGGSGVGGAATLPSWVTPSLLSRRPECQAWTGTLLLGTGLLYCARVSVPVCAVSMSQDFGWNKKEAGVVLSSFFWGYCLTQVVGGHLGDR